MEVYSFWKYILFDLDGTLTNSSKGIINSIIYAYSSMHKEIPSQAELLKYIGPPLIPAFQEIGGFTYDEAFQAAKKFQERYENIGLFENKPYNNIKEVLNYLNQKGKKLVVATSKTEYLAKRVLQHFGMSRYFVEVVGSLHDESRATKKDVIMEALKRLNLQESDKSDIIMIGDRKYDIIGAHECGIKALGVYYGFAEENELETAGADYIVHEVRDILRITC